MLTDLSTTAHELDLPEDTDKDKVRCQLLVDILTLRK